MCYFRTVPLSGEKIQTNTGPWYLLGVLFKISEENLHSLNMEEPPPPPLTPFARSNLQKVNVIRTELHEDLQYFYLV